MHSTARTTKHLLILLAPLVTPALSSQAAKAANAKPIVATPVLSPAAGTYHKTINVKITDSTPGAAIYYALHGATPTSHSARYTGPIAVKSSEAIKAVAIVTGDKNSAIAEAMYKIDLPEAAEPVFTPPGRVYLTSQKVKIEDASPGAAIYYTTDGSNPTPQSARYTDEIDVTARRETIKALAAGPELKASAVASAAYEITGTVATPVFHPAGGGYSQPVSVSITDSTAGASVRYTTDGSTPNADSALYTSPITLPVSPDVQVLKAIGTEQGFVASAVATSPYTVTPLVATPVFFPAPGSYSAAQTVTISDSTKNSAIYYTTDGSAPTPSSRRYTGPIQVSSSQTVLAIAVSGRNTSAPGGGTYTIANEAAQPAISTAPAQNGAVIVTLAGATSGGTIYYTTDGSTPTTSSTVYLAPFLVASKLTLRAIAVAEGRANSAVVSRDFTAEIPSGTLVWSDEFSNAAEANTEPNPQVWTYDTGDSGFGNNELENYCAWGSNASPCSAASPNAYVGTDGYLHIVAQQPSPGAYTSARLKTQGLFSFRYGRFEVRAMVPEAQGFWPAAWLMGNNIATVNWPDCGEQDDLERVDAATTPDWNEGSVHGPGFTGGNLGTRYTFPAGQTAAQWHTYGMIWSEGKVSYYVDDPTKPYATYTPQSLSGLSGARWPFDAGQSNFILLNLAVGGDWPGSPDANTPFPSEFLIDYVRVYTN
jgi:beta-glucanase (GH16 family)